MLYFYGSMIGLLIGIALYIFGYFVDKIRTKFNKPLKYLDFFIIPIIVLINVAIQEMNSQNQVTTFESFMIIVLYGIFSVLAYFLLNRFVKDITGGFIMRTKDLSLIRWIYLITIVLLIIIVYVGVIVLSVSSY